MCTWFSPLWFSSCCASYGVYLQLVLWLISIMRIAYFLRGPVSSPSSFLIHETPQAPTPPSLHTVPVVFLHQFMGVSWELVCLVLLFLGLGLCYLSYPFSFKGRVQRSNLFCQLPIILGWPQILSKKKKCNLKNCLWVLNISCDHLKL